MNLEGDMDTIPLRRSERIRNRIRNEIKNGVERSSTLCKMKRKCTTATSVQCEKNNMIGRPKLATSPFSMLPDGLVIEILSLLPPKLLFRCRSVCKSWLSLSSDAFRSNKHLQPTVIGFFYNFYSYLSQVPLVNYSSVASFSYLSCGTNEVENADGRITALPPCLNSLMVLDCCNGLVLLSALSQSKRRPFVKMIYVYNPATQNLSTLGCLSKFLNEELSYFSLAFDTRAPSLLHLIFFTGCIKEGVMLDRVNIYSFEEGKRKCKRGKKLAPHMTTNRYSKGTFLDGRLHRLTTQNELLSIDPNDCSSQVIRLPDLENLTLVEIGQSQGLLHCMSVCDYRILSIWVLKSYSRQEWTMKHQLCLHQIYPVSQPYIKFFDVCRRIKFGGNFAFHPQKDVLFMPLGPSCLLTFDLSSSKREELNDLVGFELFGCWLYMPFYSV